MPADSGTGQPLIAIGMGPNGATVVAGEPSGHIGNSGPGCLSLSWHWDGEQLTVNSDPYGFFPAFYWSGEKVFALGLDPASLLGSIATPQIDAVALSIFLQTGVYFHDRTFLEDVRAVPDSGRLTWSPESGLTLGRRSPPTTLDPDSDPAELAEEYVRLWSRAMAMAPDQPAVIPLSGGRDSRMLLLEWLRQGRPITRAITVERFPMRWSNDVELASLLADRVGAPHDIIEQSTRLVSAERTKNAINGFSFLDGVWKLALMPEIDSRADVVLDGLANDVLARGNPAGLEAHLLHVESAVAAVDNMYPSIQRDLLFQFDGFELIPWQELRDEVVRAFEGYRGGHNPLTEMTLWNRTRRQNAAQSVGIYRPGSVFAPALEEELFQFLRSLPLRLAKGKPFQDDVIRRAFPDVTGIGYEKKPPSKIPWGFRTLVVKDLLDLVRRTDGLNVQTLRTAIEASKVVVSGTPARFWRLDLSRTVYLSQVLELLDGQPQTHTSEGPA